eukprot:1136401-Pelagomonas_calceolata.AAC.3
MAVDTCYNFLFAILDMTATISLHPCPPGRDFQFEHEGWNRLMQRGGVGNFEIQARQHAFCVPDCNSLLQTARGGFDSEHMSDTKKAHCGLGIPGTYGNSWLAVKRLDCDLLPL